MCLTPVVFGPVRRPWRVTKGGGESRNETKKGESNAADRVLEKVEVNWPRGSAVIIFIFMAYWHVKSRGMVLSPPKSKDFFFLQVTHMQCFYCFIWSFWNVRSRLESLRNRNSSRKFRGKDQASHWSRSIRRLKRFCIWPIDYNCGWNHVYICTSMSRKNAKRRATGVQCC